MPAHTGSRRAAMAGAVAIGALAFGLGAAQAAPAAKAAPAPPLVTHAASPPATTRAAIGAQPLYPSSEARYAALKSKAHPPRAVLPNWTGLWLNKDPFAFDPGKPYTDGPTSAPLNAKYAAIYKKTLEEAAQGREWDPLSQCLPAGYPRMLAENHPFDLIVSPGEVWVLGELMNEAHRIYTDGRQHRPPEDAYPLWDGDAVGFWDDDTLIVHTNSVMNTVSGYQRNGPYQSTKATTVEQWRMVDKDTIILQMTVYDPEVLTGPWRVGPRTFKRSHDTGLRAEFYDCAGTSRVNKSADGGTQLLLPGDPGFNAEGGPGR